MERDDRIVSQALNQLQQKQKLLQHVLAQNLNQYVISQEVASESLEQWQDLDTWNPLALSKNFQSLDKRVKEKPRSNESQVEQIEEEQEILPIEKLEQTAETYERKNPELPYKSLLNLRIKISQKDSSEVILRKVRQSFEDLSLADEALEFLIETADEELKPNLRQAQEELRKLYRREIIAGKNIASQARYYSSSGLGSSSTLRDLYRDITGNPRDAYTLFQELFVSYSFEKMKTVIQFMLNALGTDIKSKGPSIQRAELSKLMNEARNMQAILGVYRYFFSRMSMITTSFNRQSLQIPKQLSFELLSKLFIQFIQEKYPSSSKVLSLSKEIGISDQLLAQIIIYVQYRDAMRQVAPRLFRDERHRQELLLCLMETLEELEEELEE
ncbi:MAG: hypothetical protein N3A69_06665 [Leptospiraceae bacterium]|nr:hypothetical protein [Leptospiraceae bacterium]